MKEIRDFFIVVTCLFICSVLMSQGCDKDDTDTQDKRSGLVLYTDHKTGLQYLGNPMGGITPRLDANGKHMRK